MIAMSGHLGSTAGATTPAAHDAQRPGRQAQPRGPVPPPAVGQGSCSMTGRPARRHPPWRGRPARPREEQEGRREDVDVEREDVDVDVEREEYARSRHPLNSVSGHSTERPTAGLKGTRWEGQSLRAFTHPAGSPVDRHGRWQGHADRKVVCGVQSHRWGDQSPRAFRRAQLPDVSIRTLQLTS